MAIPAKGNSTIQYFAMGLNACAYLAGFTIVSGNKAQPLKGHT